MIKLHTARMQRFFIIFVCEETRFALFPLRVKDGGGDVPTPPRYTSGVVMIDVVIERGQ